MSDTYQSLSHSRWNCKYHVVFVPKRRRKVLEFIPIYGTRCLRGKEATRWLVDRALACSSAHPRSWISPT
jgi:hypothetical protein